LIMSRTLAPRRYDLDWLRVLSILAVFIFHCGRFFDLGDWHVKNPSTYYGMDIWTAFLGSWMMPLIFVVSGSSLFYAIGKGRPGKFLWDKVLRLVVPLTLGVFTHAALMVYLERLTHGQFNGSFFQFLPHYFEGWYGFGGNFAWMGLHLWYLLILFVFTLLLTPLFYWLAGAARSGLGVFAGFLARPGVVFLLALPAVILTPLMDPNSILGIRSFGGWALPVYLTFFLGGFILSGSDKIQETLRRQRWAALIMAIGCVAGELLLQVGRPDSRFGSTTYFIENALLGFNAWCWILAFSGFALRHLTFNTPFLSYANEAVMPFYVMHQTVILSIGYFVVRWPVASPLKFLIIAVTAFACIVLAYEFLVRRNNVLRILFGMRPVAASRPAPQPAPARG
jgi:glucan biosynthesis protein C